MANQYYDLRVSLDRFLVTWSMSNFADQKGTTNPTSGLSLGMTLYRTDQDKLCQLTGMSPSVWTQLPSDYFVFDFDNHPKEAGYPERPLVGARAFTVKEDSKLLTVESMIGLSLFAEQTLWRHHLLMGQLFKEFSVGKSIPVMDFTANTGVIYDNMLVMNGTEAFPISSTEVRVFQFLGFSAGTGVTIK
jgi:hypothetical protein